MDDTDTTPQDAPQEEVQVASEIESDVLPDVDEAQAVEPAIDPNQAPGAVSRLLDLERSVKTYYQSLQSKREELKKNRDMVNDALSQDKLYEEHQQQADELKRKQNQLKDQVMNIPSIIAAKEEMKHLGEEIKDMQRSLSKFLLEYRRLSNSTHIQVGEGEFFEIVEDAKLIKSKSPQ